MFLFLFLKMTMMNKSQITLMFTVVSVVVLIPVLAWGADYANQEITSTITLSSGGTHTIHECNIHSGGQIVLEGGGSVTITSSNVTVGAGDSPPAIIVESVSSPLHFTMESTTLISPNGNSSVRIKNLLQAGSTVSITGNTFGDMSDVVFTGVADLLPSTSIIFKSNLVKSHNFATIDEETYPFVLHLGVVKMSGGQMLVEGNTGASPSDLPSVGNNEHYHLLRIVDAVYTTAQAGSITVIRNSGLFPVLWLQIGASTTPNAEATVLVDSNTAITQMNGELPALARIRLQEDTSPRTTHITLSSNYITEYVHRDENENYIVHFEEMSSVDGDDVSLIIVNNTQTVRNLPVVVSGTDMFVAAARIETSSSNGRTQFNTTITNNTLDIVLVSRELVCALTILFTDLLQGGAVVISDNVVSSLGSSDSASIVATVNTFVLDRSRLVIDSNTLQTSGSIMPAIAFLSSGLEIANGSMFAVTNNAYVMTNTSMSAAASAIVAGSPINVLDTSGSTLPLIDISFNNISGECPSTYDIFVPPSSLGGFASTTRGTGCHNYVCGVYKRNLLNTSSTGSGILWDVCPDTTTPAPTTTTTTTTTTPSTTTTTTPTTTTTTTTASTVMNTTTTATTASPGNQVNTPITTYPDQPSTPTGLSAAGMIVGGVSGSLDSASSVQVMSMMSVMACRTDGEDEGTARLFLTPLRIDDSLASADLIGSITLAAGICGLYYAITTIVVLIVGKRGPTMGDPIPDREGEQYTEDGAAHATEMRVFRAKLFLLYPRIPFLVVTLLFPGVVFDSCSLLYGTLGQKAYIGERVLGGVCLAASVAFCALHVVTGAVSLSRVRSQDAVKPIGEETEKQDEENPKDDGAVDVAMYSVPATPGEEADADHPSQLPADNEHPGAAVVIDESIHLSKDGEDPAVNEVDPTADPRSRVWFILYAESDRGLHPRFLELLLLPDGRWNSVASRSWCAVVTSLKAAAWGAGRCCAHNIVRMLLISVVAAINPSTATGCKVVQSLIAAISFVHGALLLVARIYRIPVLNPLQGLQSILVGLLALASFIDNHQAQSAFSTTLIITAVLISILSLLAILLEIRVQKKRKAAA